MKKYYLCCFYILNAIWNIISSFELKFEMNEDDNQLFAYLNISDTNKKMLIDTGSYITWIKTNYTKSIDCHDYFKFLTTNSSDNSLLISVKYETGIALLIPQSMKLTNVIINKPNNIALIIGIAQYLDIKTYNSFEGILGLGKSQNVIKTNSDATIFDSIIDKFDHEFDSFSIDFIHKKIIFTSSNKISLNFKFRFYRCEELTNFWEITIKRFIINTYDICKDYKRYYSKCSIIIDSGTQYFTFQNELLSQAIQSIGSGILNENSAIKIQFENNDIIMIERKVFIKEEKLKPRIKGKRQMILFQRNNLKKIVLGINFIKEYHIIFDNKHQGIWIKNALDHSPSSHMEIPSLIKQWRRII